MGRTKPTPRYRVHSIRLSDEEKAEVERAAAAGMAPEYQRNLFMYAARLFSTNTDSPLMQIIKGGN